MTGLDAIGLGEADEAIYRMLVDAGPCELDELARALPAEGVTAEGVAAEGVAAALANLAARGLVTALPGAPPRFAAAPPEVGLPPLLLAEEAALARARATVTGLLAGFRSAAGDGGALTAVVSDPDEVRRTAADVQLSAQRELRVFDKPPYTHDPLDNPAETKQLTNGVLCRVVYEPSSLAVPGRLAHLEAMAHLHEYARVVPDLPTKLILCDDRLAVVPLAGATDLEQAVLVRPSPLLDALMALFEATWLRAVPLHLVSSGTGVKLDADQRRLLALLSTGVEDDEVGHRLGLSARTLHRRIGALMAELGVSTRFQIGVAAARRGWL